MNDRAPAAKRASFREVFAQPHFGVLFTARVLVTGGYSLQIMALSVLILRQTGSALLGAVTFGIAFLPQVVGGTLLGSLADRMPPRRLIAAIHGIEAAAAAILALGVLPVAPSLLLVAAVGLITPVLIGANSRLIAHLLTGELYVLGRSLTQVASSAAQLAGLATGGILLAALGPRQALLAAAIAFTAAGLLMRLRFPALPAPANQQGQKLVLRRSASATRHLLSSGPVRRLLVAQWLPPACATGAESLVAAYAIGNGYPAGSAGLLLACLPAGMIAGDLLMGRVLPPALRPRLVVPFAVILGLPLTAFGLTPPLSLSA